MNRPERTTACTRCTDQHPPGMRRFDGHRLAARSRPCWRVRQGTTPAPSVWGTIAPNPCARLLGIALPPSLGHVGGRTALSQRGSREATPSAPTGKPSDCADIGAREFVPPNRRQLMSNRYDMNVLTFGCAGGRRVQPVMDPEAEARRERFHHRGMGHGGPLGVDSRLQRRHPKDSGSNTTSWWGSSQGWQPVPARPGPAG